MRKILSSLVVAMLFFAIAGQSQNLSITGKVTDDKGAPIPSASVVIKSNRNTGTAADDQGRYKISAVKGNVLVFSSVGFATKEITVGTSNTINVTLSSSGSELTEVVVTALGIKRSEKALGYAVSKVDPTTLLQKSEPNILLGLAGRVPGVDIRAGQGAPGSAARIQIRGVASFNGSEPLIVVDGIPYSNPVINTTNPFSGGGTYGNGLANLDQNDIESITVLKSAAASSLYGSRGANGVLLITTKSGAPKKGQKSLNITYRAGFSQESISSLPDFQNTYGAGANFTVQGANGSWGGKFGQGNIYNGSGGVIRRSASLVDSIPATTWATMFSSYPELFPNGMIAYKAIPDNVSSLFNTGNLFENSLSLQGGEGNTLFNITISRTDQKGYITNTSYKKNNFSVGGQTKVGKLTIGASMAYNRSEQVGGYIGGAQSFITEWGRTFTMARNWDITGYPSENLAGQQIGFNDGQYTNPIFGAKRNRITSIDDRLVATLRGTYEFKKGLSLNYNLGVNSYALFRDQIIDKSSLGGTDNLLGNIIEVVTRQQELQSSLYLLYKPRISDDWSLDLRIGNDINERSSRSQQVQGVNFVIPGIYNLTNTSTQRFSGDSRSKRRLVGYYANASFGFRNFAFLDLTGRNDLTSTLPYKNASYFYPGVTTSFVYTDAIKMNSDIFTYGKIRAAYAQVGNDAAPGNGEPIFGLNSAGFQGQSLASRGNSNYDPNLTPEFTKEWEFGADNRWFKGRVETSVTYYDKRTTGLIYAIGLPQTTGYTSFYTNLGEISNKGWEAFIDVKVIDNKKDFQWNVRTIFTKNINTTESLVAGLKRDIVGGRNWIEPGFPYGYLRGSRSARTEDGRLLINPSNGAPFVDPNEGMVGDPNPEYKIGITNTINYKAFNLQVLWDMTKGGDFYSDPLASMLGRGVLMDTRDRERNVVVEGVYANPTPVLGADGFNRYVPLLVNGQMVPNQTRMTTNDLYFSPSGTGGTFAVNGPTEWSVFDGTIYRLREVVFAYNVSPTLIKKLKLTAATLSFSGRNLWFWAPNVPKSSRWDTDNNSVVNANTQGNDNGGAPSTKRFGLNLNITF